MNTDQFEGHTPAPWIIAFYDGESHELGTGCWYVDDEDDNTVCRLDGTAQKQDPTAKLIAAAPDLLKEVKRLREAIDVYSILDEAYLELEGMGKQWVDNNWKALCTTWSEHMLDPENWGGE